MSPVISSLSAVLLYRTCPWCARHWRAGACRCLPAVDPNRRTLPGFDLVLALHHYDMVMQRFVLAAKNGGRRDLLVEFGHNMAAILPASPGEDWVITWVPASRRGRRQRGYDQARLLARAVSGRSGIPTNPLLTRVDRGSQGGRGRSDRLAVGPELRCRVKRGPMQVVVVDDVVTTGASLVAAGSALRSAGVTNLVGLCVASARGYRTKVASPSGGVRSMVIP